MLGTTVQLYDTNRSRAEMLHEKMSEVAAGLLRMKTDAYCFPTKLAGMVNPTDARDTFCGIQGSDNWKGPYTAVGTRFGTDAVNSKDMVLEQITPSLSVYLDEVVISANSNAGGPSNEKKAWILKTHGLTSEIQTLFLDYCSKPVAGATGQPKSRCFAEASGQVGFLVDANEGWEQYYAALTTPAVVADGCKGAACVPVAGPATPVNIVNPCIGGACTPPPTALCPDGTPPVAGVCPTTPLIKYCPDGQVMSASGICPATPNYCPDGITVIPASGVCPTKKTICIVGVDPACPNPPPPFTGGGSSSSGGGTPGWEGSDGQLYSSPNAIPGTDKPCSDCNRKNGTTDEKDVADATAKGMDGANATGSSIGSVLSSMLSGFADFVSSWFGGSSSSGGGNNSTNSGQHADGSGGESGNNTQSTGHSGGCSSSGC